MKEDLEEILKDKLKKRQNDLDYKYNNLSNIYWGIRNGAFLKALDDGDFKKAEYLMFKTDEICNDREALTKRKNPVLFFHVFKENKLMDILII